MKNMANPTYVSWCCMKQRCQNPNNPRYDNYKGKDICDRWQSFDNFLQDMGERPVGKTLGRINNELGYFKDNCSWQTPAQQQRNTSRSVLDPELVFIIRDTKKTWTGSDRSLARDLAKSIHVKEETIRDVLKGRIWRTA